MSKEIACSGFQRSMVKDHCVKVVWTFIVWPLCEGGRGENLAAKIITDYGKMADVSLIKFIPANKKIEASPLYNDELLENSFLNKFNASDGLVILHEEQLKTPNAIDGNAGMSLITNKLVLTWLAWFREIYW